ncbi:hypothetical protein [Halovivax limisalsi]|uniref:hypothetical protein n=1 Tax=Halovivax limisalsi TaxID=1453760 RepID=UPI001FFD8174|nr:hypothetical protein [Halovivax limisalsi]
MELRLDRPSAAIGAVGGLTHVLLVVTLLSYFDYSPFVTSTGLVFLSIGVFILGALPLAVSAYTRLLLPSGGLLALAASVTVVEVTTPAPQKVVELGGHAIIDGSFHALRYADSWYLWLSILLVAGLAEFAIRRGYAIGDDRLRHLPEFSLVRSRQWTVVAACSIVVGTGTMVLLIDGTLWDTVPGYVVGFGAAAVATAVPFAALLARGLVSPVLLYSLVITTHARAEAFSSPDGLAIVFLGFMAVVFAIVAVIEWLVRSRLFGWDGGRFVDSQSLSR